MPILPPDLGISVVTFSLWHVAAGERVSRGERLAEVLIPGVAVELLAEATGVLAEAIARPGDRLAAGQPLGFIEAEPNHE